jgi:N-acetyl-anhydromuramyl-L-alanine amidase AmpD
MAKHVKLFEGWLDDIANAVKSAITGEPTSSTTGSNETSDEWKSEFEDDIIDISVKATQPEMSPMKDDKYFVVHHTAGRGTAEDVVRVLNDRGLGVQWVIDREGKVFQTLPDGVIGWHAGHKDQKDAPTDLQNKTAQGVEVIAKNDSDILPVQVSAAFKLIKYLGYDKNDVWGHGEVTHNKEADEGKTIVDFWRAHHDKSPEEADKILQLEAGVSGQPANFRA